MRIICFEPMETDNNGKTTAICGAVQMTGFDPAKHTLRSDLPCRGCGQVGNFDSADKNSLLVVNKHIKPVREL